MCNFVWETGRFVKKLNFCTAETTLYLRMQTVYHLHTCTLPVSPSDCDFVLGKRLFEPTEDSSDHEEIVTRTDQGIGGHIPVS